MLKRFILLASFIIIAAVLLLPGCTAEYEVKLNLASDEGGTVYGEGFYEEGDEVTVRAEAEEGYSFEAWQRNGEEIGAEPTFTFIIEEDTELTAHFINNKEALNDYLETADEALNKGNWAKAGEYLEKASKIPGSKDTPIFAAIEDKEKPVSLNLIDILKNERIITKEQIKAGIEELESQRPSEPGQDVLEKDPETLHDWLKALVKWRNELYNLPYPYLLEHGGRDEAILEIAGPKETELELGKYLKDPSSGMRFFDFKLGEVEFSMVPAGGALGLDEGTTFIVSDKPKLLDASVEQDSIVLNFELNEEMDHSKQRGTAGPGRYRVICDIYWKEDDTFRLGLSTWEPEVEKLD